MELRHLRSFVAVAERLSFIRAAEHLHLSQPALSAQIQALEEELNVQLLERNKRTVRLSAAGAAFLGQARATLAQADLAVQTAQRAAVGESGTLRIGFVASAAMDLVPMVVLAFRKKYPGVKLELQNQRTVMQVASLLEHSMDVGYVRLPTSSNMLTITPVHREPFALILPRNHPLARMKSLDLKALQNEPFIAYARRWAPGFYDRWVSIFTRAGFSPEVTQETGDMYTTISLVAAGVGVAVVPLELVRLRARGVVVRRLPGKILSEIGVAVRNQDNSSLVQNFLALSRTVGKKMSGNK
jgi:DNA-binding transcriptional LysR family regulator